jgi:hypothetical protein
MTHSIVEPSLAKKLLLLNNPKQKIANEAAQMAAELLRLFIIEARQRAAIEAECESEGAAMDRSSSDDEADALGGDADSQGGGANNVVSIRADHITKVAAELLMDFS